MKFALRLSTALTVFLSLVGISKAQLTATQTARIIPQGVTFGDRFGARGIDSSGDRMVVGSNRFFGIPKPAYVYRRMGSTWIEEARLLEPGADGYGSPVAMDGDTIVVCAMEEHTSVFNEGAAYVYVRSGTDWNLQARLTASDGAFNDNLGTSVALQGDRLVLGAFEADGVCPPMTDCDTGAVYVFERTGTTWVETAKLLGSDALDRDRFGVRVALDGDTIAASAWLYGVNGSLASHGGVFVFEYDGTNWAETAVLSSSAPVHVGGFGTSLSVQADLIAVGEYNALGLVGRPGSVHLFERVTGGWQRTQSLLPGDGRSWMSFGTSVDLKDDLLAVGAQGDTSIASSGTGTVFLYEREATGWRESLALGSVDTAPNDSFGGGVFLLDNSILVGAGGVSDGGTDEVGAVYEFELARSPHTYFCPGNVDACTSCPCGNDARSEHVGGCLNSSSWSATLTANGSASLSNYDLSFDLRGASPESFALLFSGENPLPIAGVCPPGSGIGLTFFDGLRCVAVNLCRHGGQLTDARGRTITPWTPSPSLSCFEAGQTRFFQSVYRDDPNLGCGTGRATSNGVSVRFLP